MIVFVLLLLVFLLIGLLFYGIDKRQIIVGQMWVGALMMAFVIILLSFNWTLQQIVTLFMWLSVVIVSSIVIFNIIYSYIRGHMRQEQAVKGHFLQRFKPQFVVMGTLGLMVALFLFIHFTSLYTVTFFARIHLFLALIFAYLAFHVASFLFYSQLYIVLSHTKFPQFIVVLGQKLQDNYVTLSLQNRLHRAIELFEASNRTALIIVTGGQTDPRMRSEAEAMKEYLIVMGVPEELIIEENQALNTRENFRFAKYITEDYHMTGTGVFVTSTYHLLRSAMVAKEVGLDANGVAAPADNHRVFGYVFARYIRDFYGYMALNMLQHSFVVLFLMVFVSVI